MNVEINMNKIILSNEQFRKYAFFTNGSDDAGILLDIWGFILIG